MRPALKRRDRGSERLRIAMVGQRGVPATYGGIEHHVEELGARLAARGHEVTVFCRRNYVADRLKTYRGMRLVHLPTIGTKHLDAIVHSGLSATMTLGGRYDIVQFHGIGPGMMAVLPRFLSTAAPVLTVHGLDDERAKWGPLAGKVFRSGGRLTARAFRATICVSEALTEHYQKVRGSAAVHIPNGVVAPVPRPPQAIVSRFGLEPGKYALFVGRLVPEKAPDLLLRAFRSVPGDVRLVLAGGSSFTDDYVAALHREAQRDRRVLFAGYVYGAALDELYQHAGAFVLPSTLEGLPLTMLEAASHGTPVIASDIPPHREVLGFDGPGRRIVPIGDEDALARAMTAVLADPGTERAGAAVLREEVLGRYDWDEAATATERLYAGLVGRPAPKQ